MPDIARRLTAPVIAAAVCGAVAVALAIAFFVVVLPDHKSSSSTATGPAGGITTRERMAMNAAVTEAVNLQSFRRDHFDADWNRALNGATGSLRSDLLGRKSETRTVLTKTNIDLRAEVQDSALVGPGDGGNGYVVIVTINGYQVRDGKTSDPIPQRIALTMVLQNNKWLASDVSQRGTS